MERSFLKQVQCYSSRFADPHKGCCPVTVAKGFRASGLPPENDLSRPHCWRVRHWFQLEPGVGGSHVKAYGDVPPKWVTFSPKILRHGSQFGLKKKKKSLQEGPISQNLRRTYKISRFWKTLRTWSQLAKISGKNKQTKTNTKTEKQKQTNQPFLREKNP